jgi:CheY-like chemotaxis protein
MQIPDTPAEESDSPATFLSATTVFESRPRIMIQGGTVTINPRKRQKNSPVAWSFGTSTKRRDDRDSPWRDISPRSERSNSIFSMPCTTQHPLARTGQLPPSPGLSRPTPMNHGSNSVATDPSTSSARLRPSWVREVVPTVIYEALRVGGRPDSSVGQPTPLGEKIEVRTRSSNGHASYQIIEWSVKSDVPEVVPVDERDLSKLISCVFLNAIKFTENGTISVLVSLSNSLRSIRINIIDSGAGIPKAFVPELFKPFSREDASLTRTREGLGLGLLVAKGLARTLGGDLKLVHTETSGPTKGTEFEIKIPIGGVESGSGTGTPFDRTPTPSSTSSQVHRSEGPCKATSSPRPGIAIPIDSVPPLPSNDQLHTTSSDLQHPPSTPPRRLSYTSSKTAVSVRSAFDRKLAEKHPLSFLVAEDNKINRKLLVSMLSKLGYEEVYEAFDGREAVRRVKEMVDSKAVKQHHGSALQACESPKCVDIILMDLWMPEMDGYAATEKILDLFKLASAGEARSMSMSPPVVIAVSADITEQAISRATAAGMEGFMTKPYKLVDLQRLIEEVCDRSDARRVF